MSPPLLSVREIVAGYVRGLPILQGVSIDVGAHEIVTLIGPNGAGKSTLVKAIIGLLRTERGRIALGDREITSLPTHRIIASGVGYVPQTGNVFTNLTIHENLRVGGHLLRGELAERTERAYALFPFLGDRRRQSARTLSGGERQMLAMARALMTSPSVLMLDEPTAGLAPLVAADVFRQLRRLAESGVAVLMVEQNARAALRVSDRGYVLAQGRNYADGPAAQLLANPAVGEAFLGGKRAPA